MKKSQTLVNYPVEYEEAMNQLYKKTGIKKSEFIRRAIKDALQKNNIKVA